MQHPIILRIWTFCAMLMITPGRATSVQDQIRFLLDEEKNLRQDLQAKVQRLQVQTFNLNASIASCQCVKPVTQQQSGSTIAYTGTLSTTLTSLTGSTAFNFTGDLVNVGHAFDMENGHFVIPASGLYGFSLTLFMNPGYRTALTLLKNGNQILSVKTGHYSSRQYSMGTNYVIGNFSVGEEIMLQYNKGSGSRLFGSGVTTFTGVFLHKF